MGFEWDEEKATANLAKHGVSFEEARTIFDDPLYVDFYDPTIPLKSTVILSSGCRGTGVCCWFRTRSEAM
jgi:uncharacterized DUF497 family protein